MPSSPKAQCQLEIPATGDAFAVAAFSSTWDSAPFKRAPISDSKWSLRLRH
jgi:hypothetical protein